MRLANHQLGQWDGGWEASVADPLVSIVIPCYNYAQYLEECLASVREQTYPHWEAVVVDDASVEGDPAAVVAATPDPRIRYVRHTHNQGLAAARNTGIRATTGEFVLPLDSDDRLAPRYLEKLGALLNDRPDYNAVFPDFHTFGASEGTIHYRVRDTRALLLDQWIPGPGSLFLRTLWQQVGGYWDPLRAGNEDWDFWLGAAEHGLQVGHLAEPLYYYRQHGDSMAIRQQYTEYQTRDLLYGRHRALFDRFGLGRAFRAEGYRRSAVSAWQRSERNRALALAAQGFRLAPWRFTQASLRPLRRALHR